MFFSDILSAGLARLYSPEAVPRRELDPRRDASEGLYWASVVTVVLRPDASSSDRPTVSSFAML